MAQDALARYDFVISRRRYDPKDMSPEADAYGLWRFDPAADELLTSLPLDAGARFDRRHSLVQIGDYLLEWGPLANKDYQPSFPYRLFTFDPTSRDPLGLHATTTRRGPHGPQTVPTTVQKGLWTKTKFWMYRPDFGNPQGAHEGYDSGEELLLIPVGSWLLNLIPTEGRGTFQLWNFDPSPLAPGRADPLPAPYQPQGSFDFIDFGHQLLPLNNYVLDWVPATGDYMLLSFDPQNVMPLALPAVQQGRWADIDAGHQLVPFGDVVLDWVPADRSYRLWQFDPKSANPLARLLRWGTLPAAFDAMTTLTAVQPRVPVDAARAQMPGTIDFMRAKVKHVVYLMLENRSFDHVLGWLYEQGERGINFVGDDRPFDGASTGMFNVDPGMDGQKVFLSRYQDGQPSDKTQLDFLPNDPYHDKSDVLRQMFFGVPGGYAARAKPQMTGFVWNNGVHEVMMTYTPAQLPVINGLAREFAVSDEWFCSMPSATDPNRAFAFTGSALQQLNNFQNGKTYIDWPDFSRRQSLWTVLWSQGITDWKMYHSVDWMGFVHTYHLFLQGQIPYVDANNAAFIFGIDEFKQDARAGRLPAFSYLEPAWIAPQGTTSYHPGADLVPGERALAELYEAMRAGPAWNETLFIITFDEHGGVFDHAPPPYAEKPWPNDANDGFAYDLLGPRVPAIVVSPWIEKQTVFRSGETTPFDHTSILATVLSWFGVPRSRWALGDRTHHAPTFEKVLTRAAARTDAPATLPVPSDAQFPPQGAPTTALPVHDLHRLMAPRLVWEIVKDKRSPQEAMRLAEEILAGAGDLQTLHALLDRLAKEHA
jgi:phospholipase C